MLASTMPSPADSPAAVEGRLSLAARLFVLVLIIAAFALRAYHLDYQSLWSDEGISLLRAAQPLGQLWRNMPVEHVPGYFLLLHFWMALTGDADYALRYLSLLPSVFAVALTVRMGRDLGSTRIGIIAATLLATGAFQVWYAQEVRMYTWLLAAGLVSTWCLWLLLMRPPTVAVWLGYVLSTAAAVYLHYFGFLVPIVHTIVVSLHLLIRRDRRVFLLWLAAGATVSLLFLPWAARALQLLGFSGWRAPLDPNRIPWLLLQNYTAGETMAEPWSRWVAAVYLVLTLVGAVAWYRRKPAAGLFLAVIAASSVLLTWLLVIRRPDFHVRYTIFVSAPLILLAAGGIAGLDPGWWRSQPHLRSDRHSATRPAFSAIPWAALALLILANGLALNRLYYDVTVNKPDFRSAAAHIQDNLLPGDIVLIDGPNPRLVFEHYYDGPAPVHDLRLLENLSDAKIDAALQEITAGASRAWELLYFKPPGPVQVWLATRGWAAAPSDHNGIRVQLVGLPAGPLQEQTLDLAFGEALELVSAEYQAGPYRAGELVRLSTNWYVHSQPPEYKFSLRLLNDAGEEVRAEDYVPQNWFAPTYVWHVGKPARDQHGLLLPDDLEPGLYRVTLRLYDPYSGVAVETAQGVDVPIAEFTVEDGPARGQ